MINGLSRRTKYFDSKIISPFLPSNHFVYEFSIKNFFSIFIFRLLLFSSFEHLYWRLDKFDFLALYFNRRSGFSKIILIRFRSLANVSARREDVVDKLVDPIAQEVDHDRGDGRLDVPEPGGKEWELFWKWWHEQRWQQYDQVKRTPGMKQMASLNLQLRWNNLVYLVVTYGRKSSKVRIIFNTVKIKQINYLTEGNDFWFPMNHLNVNLCIISFLNWKRSRLINN